MESEGPSRSCFPEEDGGSGKGACQTPTFHCSLQLKKLVACPLCHLSSARELPPQSGVGGENARQLGARSNHAGLLLIS